MKNMSELDEWFYKLNYVDKLCLYEGREKLGVE